MSSVSNSELAFPQSAEEGAAFEGGGLSQFSTLLAASTGLAAGLAWAAFGVVSLAWPDVEAGDWSQTRNVGYAGFVIAALIAVLSVGAPWFGAVGAGARKRAPWLLLIGLFLTVWELATAKFGWLPLPFFPPPQAIVEVYTDDLPKLSASVWASVKLQLGGYAIGAILGFITGVSIGWSLAVGYWVHPILRFIGPLPATAWLPIAFFTFPSSWSASTFLIALATAFPVTVLTWSGVASVSNAYYDVARTLGAKPWFLVLKVAVPAALPHVFVGLFMGLGASFAVLVVAEMIGVKAGLGWYLQWAQGWAA
ncbi:MAG TPA: ABC transporter permease subunit, partial [Rhodopseudomonas sp.]|uniref:ABC transporter permease n=1 Tax=Rhodopseudomonas sp. TaxID=1078 RepID=UPI002ED9B085